MQQALVASGGSEAATAESLAGKYITFRLGREVYGIEILRVREIIGLLEVTRVPRAPDFIRGIINLRGRVIPVVDLRRKFAMASVEDTDQTVIIVVQCRLSGRALTMGLLVDLVLEVLTIEAAQIEPPPDLGSTAVDGEFVRGVGKTSHGVAFLLDTERVLAGAGAQALAGPAARS